MDPITAVGAVASIVQLANTALSLSKTLYTIGEAIASASDDIQALADDLRTFSQSLSLLSRLLEDSKSWYSDDVYLLTAKIIKDCAELYVKIDKILIKLGGNGKSNWKMRVKFVYKEGQIRKLMKRLRDMKGTLATILMSLQVDLQLSLLNISSASKIQRAPEKPLQPETVENLRKAQEVVESCGLLPKYSAYPDKANTDKLAPAWSAEGPEMVQTLQKTATFQQPPNLSPGIQSFVALPTMSHQSTNAKVKCKAVTGPVFSRLAQSHEITHPELGDESEITVEPKTTTAETKSVKSSSSMESFKSAVSEQSIMQKFDFSHEIKEVKELLGAFRSALDILGNLIERRIQDKQADVYFAAENLGASLADGETQLDLEHKKHCGRHGIQYVRSWTDYHLRELQATTLLLMKEIVMPLHMYTSERGDLQKPKFLILYRYSEKCRMQAIKQVKDVAIIAKSPLMNPLPEFEGKQVQTSQLHEPPEMSLPFIGYTFKRFETSYRSQHTDEAGKDGSKVEDYEYGDNLDSEQEITQLPMEVTSNNERMRSDFWIPQGTPDNRLLHFNTETGESSMELPLESPLSATENRPRHRMNVNIPNKTRPPPEIMAQSYVQKPSDPISTNFEDLDSTLSRPGTSAVSLPSIRSTANPSSATYISSSPSIAPSSLNSGPPQSRYAPLINNSHGGMKAFHQRILSDHQRRLPVAESQEKKSPTYRGRLDQSKIVSLDDWQESQGQSVGDGLAAGYQDDQLALARQLLAEFDPDSKKSKATTEQGPKAKWGDDEDEDDNKGEGESGDMADSEDGDKPQNENVSGAMPRFRRHISLGMRVSGIAAPKASTAEIRKEHASAGKPNSRTYGGYGLEDNEVPRQHVLHSMSKDNAESDVTPSHQHDILEKRERLEYLKKKRQQRLSTADNNELHTFVEPTISTRLPQPNAVSTKNSRLTSRPRKAPRTAHACEACRTLKAKCDEGRPSCSSCWEENVDCRYRDSLPQRTAYRSQACDACWAEWIEGASECGGTPCFNCLQMGRGCQDTRDPATIKQINDARLTDLEALPPSPLGAFAEPVPTLSVSSQDWRSFKASGPRLKIYEDEEGKFDAMGNKTVSTKKAKKLTRAELRQKKKDRMARWKRGEEIFTDEEDSSPGDESNDLGFKHGKASDFPAVPGKEQRNFTLKQITAQYEQPKQETTPYQGAGPSDQAPPNIGDGPSNLFGGIMAGHGTDVPGLAPPTKSESYNPLTHRIAQPGPEGSDLSSGGLINLVSSRKPKPHNADADNFKAAYNTRRFPIAVPNSSVQHHQQQFLSHEHSSTRHVVEQAHDVGEAKKDFESEPQQNPTQTEEQRSKELQEYQMSLLTNLNCRVRAGHPLPPETQQKKTADFRPEYNNQDVLQDFDFDSFLHQDGQEQVFDFNSFVHQEKEEQDSSLNLDTRVNDVSEPPEQKVDLDSHVIAPGITQVDLDEKPLYVNPKQFHRILRRRVARQKLEELLKSKPKKTKPYLHTYRRRPAQRRPRHPSGRLLTAEEIAELKDHPQQADEVQKTVAKSSEKSGELITPKAPSARLMMIPEDPNAPNPRTQLWWMAYISLHQSHFPTFATVSHELERKFGALGPSSDGVATLCQKLSALIQKSGTTKYTEKTELKAIVEIRDDIVRIVTTVDQQLGLELAIVGWACVWVCLAIIEPNLSSSSITSSTISAITEILTQLQEIVGIIARYAVMENLYQQSGGALSLKPEYKTELLSLCTSIFEYFAASFTLAKTVSDASVDLQADPTKCKELTEQLRMKDKACQGFKVVFDMKEESGSDSEEADIEDISDESWEHISAEEAK